MSSLTDKNQGEGTRIRPRISRGSLAGGRSGKMREAAGSSVPASNISSDSLAAARASCRGQ